MIAEPDRRRLLLGITSAILLAAPARGIAAGPSPAELQHLLAPTGRLRVGVYPGSPTSEVRSPSGELHGVTVELGQALAGRLQVPVELVEFPRVAEVVNAIAAGQADFTVTNASPARAERVAFTDPVLALELGCLVPAGSAVRTLEDLDQPGRRVGVTQGSTSERSLARLLPRAALVPVPTMQRVVELLGSGGLDAYATNKAVLFEMSDALPGSRVLDGRWGLEHMAIAYPKGREAAAPALADFLREARANGALATAIRRSGLRGQATDAS